MAVIWTLGVEGRSEERILNLVSQYDIRNVIDIRELPLTREGLPKWPVAGKLRERAVRYQNRRELAPGEDLRAMLLPPEEPSKAKGGDKDGGKSKQGSKEEKDGGKSKQGGKEEKDDKADASMPFSPDWDAFKDAYKEAAPEKAVRQVAADATLTPTLLISGARDPRKSPRQALCELMAEYDVKAKHIV